MSNSMKFTPPGGKIDVRIDVVEGELQFAVHDTGAGIPADKLESIFQRFGRGVGLGLYISKCIVQGHGGRIWAQSTLGQGSTFTYVHDPMLTAPERLTSLQDHPPDRRATR